MTKWALIHSPTQFHSLPSPICPNPLPPTPPPQGGWVCITTCDFVFYFPLRNTWERSWECPLPGHHSGASFFYAVGRSIGNGWDPGNWDVAFSTQRVSSHPNRVAEFSRVVGLQDWCRPFLFCENVSGKVGLCYQFFRMMNFPREIMSKVDKAFSYGWGED